MSPTARKKSAVDAPRGNIFFCQPDDLTLVTDKEHPLYDPRVEWPIDDKMVASILSKGVITPIIVRKNGTYLEVVEGRQRVKNTAEANKRLKSQGADPILVPVLVRREKDDASAFETSIVTNEIRTADDVITKAEKAQKLSERGRSDEQVASAFGVTLVTVRNWWKVLELAPQVQTAVKAGRVAASDAVKELTGMTREDQVKRLAKMEETSPTRRRAAKEDTKEGSGKKKKGSPVSRLRQIYRDEAAAEALTERERLILDWIFGEVSNGDLLAKIPRLTPVLERKKSSKPKTAKTEEKKAA